MIGDTFVDISQFMLAGSIGGKLQHSDVDHHTAVSFSEIGYVYLAMSRHSFSHIKKM